MAVRYKVKDVAKAHGYSQYRLQKESGVDVRVLRGLFRNTAEGVRLETLDRIARTLGVDVTELIESIPDDQEPQSLK